MIKDKGAGPPIGRAVTSDVGSLDFLRGNILVLILTNVIWIFALRMILPFVPLYALALNATKPQVGLIQALRFTAMLLTFPIAGYLTDKLGRIRIIVTSGYLSSAVYLLLALAPDWRVIALGNFLGGLASFSFPALSALTADSLKPSQRGIGFAVSMAIPGILAIPSPYIGGYLVTKYGTVPAMRALYLSLMATNLVVTILRMKFLRETIDISRESPVELTARKIPRLLLDSYKGIADTLRWMPRGLTSLTAILVLSFFSDAVTSPFWVVYATEAIGISKLQYGLITLLAGALNILLSIPAGLIVDRVGPKRSMSAAFLLFLLPILYFPHARDFNTVLVIYLVISLANAFSVTACQTLLANLVPRELRGRVMAALGRGMIRINVLWSGGGPAVGFLLSIPLALGSLSGGYLYTLNPEAPWVLLTATLTLCLVILFFLLKEPERPEL